MILNTIEGLKLHLGRAISQATKIDFIQSYIQLAENEFILRAIGPEMLAELTTQFTATPSSVTPANKELLTRLQSALAFYTYVKYLPYSLGTDGDNGLQEQDTEKTKPVRMGVLDKRLRESAENAANALEQALVYLYQHRTQYPTWLNSDSYKRSSSLFVFSATELTEYLPQAAGSYRLFLSLVPYLHKAEKNSIKPLIGSALYDDLKAKRVSTDPLQPADIRLLEAVGQATATNAYALALYYLNVVQTSGGGLRILSDFDGIYNQKAVDPKLLLEAQRKADGEASSASVALKAYLTENADQYPLYKNSDRYTAKGPNELPDNSQYQGVFRLR
ncbi:hypothetical protein M0L20_13570 [Spirosoma sp. RP8]|uniref:Uncharacterized protein n=1 Tax=Spirosoma liriopis TaxID=2937440 RepID=A0ABT0HL41_9BACT|nr:DUF6712 family protein [Spirosoma liriopis]MCK8492891.1 hypothetical protein [Spirosoma liriopis]